MERRHRLEPHQPHYQGLDYNNLNGGVARHYEPIEDAALRKGGTIDSLVTLGVGSPAVLAPYSRWHIEAHQFRIERRRSRGGLPTPEGVHRDGVTFVLMAMVGRDNVTGGESTVYNVEKQPVEHLHPHRPRRAGVRQRRAGLPRRQSRRSGSIPPPPPRDVLVVTYRHRA